MPTQKIDPKVIFASDAPAIDKPPVFSDKTKGWDVARANDGRPEIKQMNKMQQDTDLKILWLNENAVLPYDSSIDYPDGAVAIKDGSFKQLSSGSWIEFLDDFADKDAVKRGIANRYDSSLTYNLSERVVLTNGDIVKSTVDGNANDPNSDMTGWVNFEGNQQAINNKNNTISHVALMLDAHVVDGKIFNVLSRDEPDFALVRPYSGGGLFKWDASSSETPNGGTVFAHNTVSGGRFLRIIDSDVKVSWFAGHGWTGQDKTSRAQQAIDFANNITRTSKLIVDSLYTITSTLFIDRETNQTSGEFYVESGSDGAGFQINTPITMFSSRLPYKPADAGSYTKAACSEFTYFRDISFLSTINNMDCLVFDDKFLRLTFKDCIFNKVQAIKDAEYLQSILFDGCRIRQHVGFFLNTRDAYELRSYGHKFEDTQQGFRFYGIARGCHIDKGLFQGSVGPLVEAAGFFGSSVDKNYFEHNDEQCIKIGVLDGLNSGFSINNNLFICKATDVDNPSFYPVDIGYAVSCSISGNNSNTQIVNTDKANSFGISATGNGANGKNVLSIDAKKATTLVPVDTTSQDLAAPIDRTKVIIAEATGLSPSIRLPKLENLIISDSVTIVNRTSSTIQVFPATDERVQYVSYNEAAQILANTTATFCKTDSDYWIFF